MKKFLYAIVLLLYVLNVNAQVNLVRNPSFEQYYPHCPVSMDQIRLALGWSCIDTNATAGYPSDSFYCNAKCTPEYFNVCSLTWLENVPVNFAGYQWPRTGSGYANVWMYDDSVPTSVYDTGRNLYQRDYLMGRLYHPLESGRSYCVTFYTNKATSGGFFVNHIGAYLDDGSIDTNSFCGLPHSQYTPQVEELDIINDTLGWTKIKGSFIANGTERYITIGNFAKRLNTDTVWKFPSAGYGHNGSYYEIDDVSVIASDTRAYAGLDTLINYGDSTYIGIDSNGEGMPCYWYTIGDLITPIDSGGRILVHPLSLTTYIVVMDLCGTITMDTVVVNVRPEYFATPKPSPKEREKLMQYVHVYPNPAGLELFVEGVFTGCEVRLFNIVGVEEKMKTCNGEPCRTKPVTVSPAELRTATTIHFDLSDLAKGIYFVEVLDLETGERVVKKVVKD